MKTNLSKRLHTIYLPLFLVFSTSSFFMFAQAPNTPEDEKLLESFLESKSYQGTISFDASNIKQFWIDKSVASKDGRINITLKSDDKNETLFSSVPMKIQLVNVNETQNCKIDIITEQPKVDFSVSNTKSKVISGPTKEEAFLNYKIVSGEFRMEDASDNLFSIQFKSNTADEISIKKIILSFSNNSKSLYLASPGRFTMNGETAQLPRGITWNDGTITGKQTVISSKNNLIVSDKSITPSIKIKNAGSNPTRIYIGYYLYLKGNVPLHGSYLPFKDDKVLSVISAEAGKNTIIVDAYPEWEKNCCVALNAKANLSDIPNQSLLDGKIVEVKQTENGQAEITLDKPLAKELAKGTKIRITGKQGNSITTTSKVLQPGEELDFAETIQKNDNVFQSSSKELSKYVYYIKPLLFSYSIDPNAENTIQIIDYSVSF